MTNKTTEKAARPKRETQEPSPERLKAALEIHTLTQMIYAELAMTRPWLAAPPPGIHWMPPAHTPWPPSAMRGW